MVFYFTFGQFFWTPGTAVFCATSLFTTQHSFVYLDNSIETLALLCNVLHKWTQHFLVHSGNSLLYMEWCTQIDRWMGPMVKIGRSAQLTWHLPQSCQWPEIDATKWWCWEVGWTFLKGWFFCLVAYWSSGGSKSCPREQSRQRRKHCETEFFWLQSMPKIAVWNSLDAWEGQGGWLAPL